MSNVCFMHGNEAAAEGAIAAGCRFYAGYPITPSTEIAEILSTRLPEVGGVFIQMEDEIASMAAVIGASLGGLSSILALGARPDALSGLILVDITPKMNMDGVAGVNRFMMAKAREGFASIEEAADAVAAYLPHRPRPKSLDGLRKNLRQRDDGRFYWHWDPRFFDGPQPVNGDRTTQYQAFSSAARSIAVPLMLVRGRSSELVGDEEVADFRALCPTAEFADIAGARHMVAGDKNDIFARTILEFMARRYK